MSGAIQEICELATLYVDRPDWSDFTLLALPAVFYRRGGATHCALIVKDLAGDLHQFTFTLPSEWYLETRFISPRILERAIADWLIERINSLPRNLHPTA